MSGLRDQARGVGGRLPGQLRESSLRRLQLAGIGSVVGQWAYSIASAVYAYEAGGAKAVGARRPRPDVPSAVAAPFSSTLADRLPRIPVMSASSLGSRIASAPPAWSSLADGPSCGRLRLAGAVVDPRHAVPAGRGGAAPRSRARSRGADRRERHSSTIESVGSFVGPAIGGFLLAATSPASSSSPRRRRSSGPR